MMRTRGTSGRRTAVVGLLVAATAVSVGLAGARILYTGTSHAANLVWNLTLAWIPFILAVLVYDGHRRGSSRPALFGAAALWLLFFPNAPYLVTDFKWLSEWTGVPLWYDVLLLSLAAGTGLALGFVSLYLMHALVRRVLRPFETWLLVVAFIGLSSFGVYLGRFERRNSWDVFFQPVSLLSDIGDGLSDPLAHGRAIAVMVFFTACLTVAYGVFYRFVDIALSDDRG